MSRKHVYDRQAYETPQLTQGVQIRGAPLFDSGRVGKNFKAREGVHVQLLKVKSHIGIEGNERERGLHYVHSASLAYEDGSVCNEKADALAHEACKPECCNDIASEGVEITEDIFRSHFSGKKIHNASGAPWGGCGHCYGCYGRRATKPGRS